MSTVSTPPLGFRLQFPADWLEIKGTVDLDDIRAHLEKSFTLDGGPAPVEAIDQMMAGVQLWRGQWDRLGVTVHGILAGEVEGTQHNWNIIGFPWDLSASPGTDRTDAIRALLGQDFDLDEVFSEGFDTELGTGFGVVATMRVTELKGPDGEPAPLLPPPMGLAVAITTPTRGGPSFTYVGVSQDAEQAAQVAVLVGEMARAVTTLPND